MTGYAVATSEGAAGTLTIEIKSVNSRFLDLQFRINDDLRALEPDLRAAVTSIRALSPKRTLERGYAVLVGPDHESVSSVDDTSAGARIHAYLADGELTLDVVEPSTKEQHG